MLYRLKNEDVTKAIDEMWMLLLQPLNLKYSIEHLWQRLWMLQECYWVLQSIVDVIFDILKHINSTLYTNKYWKISVSLLLLHDYYRTVAYSFKLRNIISCLKVISWAQWRSQDFSICYFSLKITHFYAYFDQNIYLKAIKHQLKAFKICLNVLNRINEVQVL